LWGDEGEVEKAAGIISVGVSVFLFDRFDPFPNKQLPELITT